MSMTNEKRAAADGDAQEETPVLSDWLTGHLRDPRSKSIAPEDPDPALIFLERERRLRRAQQIKVAVVAVGLALLTGGYLLSRRATDPPATRPQAAAATQPAAPPVVAKQVGPARVQSLDLSDESESADAHEAVKAGLPAAIGSPKTLADKTDPGAAIPGGPSVARYPDLPREVLIQLEKATQP
jgi:hypothetical protein